MFKFLIADDEYSEQRLLSRAIREHWPLDADVQCANNGKAAVNLALLWMPDIALLDIEMPGLNGLEVAKKILSANPRTKIIFVTAYSLFEYAHEAVKIGASDYILKPIDCAEAINAIEKVTLQILSEHQLEDIRISPRQGEEHEGIDKQMQMIEKVITYLKHNFMNYGLSLDSVSEILHINPSYFSVLFKRCTGVNFIDYVTDLKINAAKDLLRDPLRPASEIARMTGYESASYFTRAFKKKTGMTPTAYRSLAYKGNSEL